MQSIPFYISYLLTRQECVIVPGLGAFVVSESGKEESKWDIISPPEKSLEFISEINQDDGLLTYCITKAENCSNEEAELLISQFVNDVFMAFDEGKTINIPRVGNLFFKDDKIGFQPERILSCNSESYGLEGFSIPHYTDVKEENITTNRKFRVKKKASKTTTRNYIYYAYAIAVAILVILIFLALFFTKASKQESTTPDISNQTSLDIEKEVADIAKNETSILNEIAVDSIKDTATQKIIEVDTIKETAAQNITAVDTIKKSSVKIITSIDTIKESSIQKPAVVSSSPEKTNQVKANKIYYYNIVASYTTLKSAKASLPLFHSKGFKNAGILEFPGRFRVYTHRFDDMAVAERFAVEFRKNNPAYSDAYILKNKE